MNIKLPIKMTMEEYEEAQESYQGICLNCGELRDETEPDAENYPCEFCGEDKVQGIENALIDMNIDIEG